MRAVIKFLVERDLLINLISVMLILMGTWAVFDINREAFPNVNLDQIQVESYYPGATPRELERLVVTPIEQELKSLDGIDKITSVSFPGSGRIILELDPRSSNRDRIVSDVQLAVDRADLPNDLPSDPSVIEIDGAVFPVIHLAVSAPLSELELNRLGDKISDDLLEISGIARIQVQGDRKAEIRVVVDPEKLARHRVSIGEISRVLSGWNVNAPGGDLDTTEGQKAVRIVGELTSADDAGDIVIRANESGGGLRLRDVATVTETLERPSRYYDVGGTSALYLLVLKKADADIITTVQQVREYLKTVPERYGESVRVDVFRDMSKIANLRLSVLTNNGMWGIVFVFITLIIFLRPSVSMSTTWGLPIVFLTGLITIYMAGITLNMISMFAFIMVLGMLVDDAIIVGENITWHMERGMPPHEAAVTGAYELLGPVTTTIMTTVIAFVPLMFVSGLIGKFIFGIPVVVITLLLFSWLESFLILPSHVALLATDSKWSRNLHGLISKFRVKAGMSELSDDWKERKWLKRLEDRYAMVLAWVLKHRWKTIGITTVVFLVTVVLAILFMPFQLFPPAGIDQFNVRIVADSGTSLEQMRSKMRAVDLEIRNRVEPGYLETTLIGVGQIAKDGGDPLTQRGSRFGQIQVIYTPAILRPDHEVVDDVRRIGPELKPLFPDLQLAFEEMKHGPPTGRALEAQITSIDHDTAEQAANNLLAYIKGVDGVTSVESDLDAGDPEIHVVVDRSLATYAGVDLATAASHVRAAVGGLVVDTTRRGTEEIDITIRYPQESRKDIVALRQLLVPNQRGGLVPLHKISELVEKPGFTAVRHQDGINIVSVAANVNVSKITSSQINRQVAKEQDKWLGELANKVTVKYGGENEKNQESVFSLLAALGFALLGIFFLLAIQFNRLSYPLIVMSAIPFGIVGIIIAFFIHDLLGRESPLSFMSLMGMVALSGVVVNSALVLLVFVQRARESGLSLYDSVMEAGRRRLRAVILTATTTVVGLLPTAYGWGGMDPFVAGMALALSWGLVFATVITLIVLPALVMAMSDIRHYLFTESDAKSVA